ncbi:hypothetical protein [Crystallibacter degradans]|uniref:hypothetical protein n=1 Tax=Crystallibacter degradans TaxID=2726743 RepID=UPI001475E3AC|nr:hypothetical protein [Arthrobacter sp. SF27]NMR30382.1 hypothetical protein [Arthrobacter sp. SF27]
MNENEPKTSGYSRREHDRSSHAGPAKPDGALPVDDPRAVAKRRREAEEKLEQHRQEAEEEAREAEDTAGRGGEDEAGPGRG